MNFTLPWRTGWLLLVILIFIDAFITYVGGAEGNPLWQPLVEAYGINILWVLAVAVLLFFYLLIRIVGAYTERIEHYPKGKELVLTSLVIAFAAYDFYMFFILPYYGYFGYRTHYIVIPFITAPVLLYNLWVEYLRRKGKIRLNK